MTLDGLLAIYGLLLGAYTLVPLESRLALKVSLSYLDYLFFLSSFFFVHYLLFHPLFTQLGLTPHLGISTKFGILPSWVAYLNCVFILLYLGLVIRNARLIPRKIGKFQEVTDHLLRSEKFHELLTFMAQNLMILKRIQSKKTFIQKSLAFLTSVPTAGEIELLGIKPANFLRKIIVKSIGFLIPKAILSYFEHRSELARNIIEVIFLNRHFVEYIANVRPTFGLKILTSLPNDSYSSDPYLREDFTRLVPGYFKHFG